MRTKQSLALSYSLGRSLALSYSLGRHLRLAITAARLSPHPPRRTHPKTFLSPYPQSLELICYRRRVEEEKLRLLSDDSLGFLPQIGRSKLFQWGSYCLMMLVNAFFLLLLMPFRGQKQSSEKLSDDEKQRGTVVRVPATIVHWKSTSSVSPPTPSVDHDVAARRALAKIRVRQDDDPNSVRQYSFFATARGDSLFTQTWTPVTVNIRGVVILMHGLNEHSGRYSNFAKQLNANGFKVYGMDWIVFWSGFYGCCYQGFSIRRSNHGPISKLAPMR